MSTDISMVKEIIKEASFTKEEEQFIENKFETLIVEKGSIILKAGDTVWNQYFVSNGCLRTFFVDQFGKEHTIQFAVNDWWISDYTAFHDNSKAKLTIECIQKATLYAVSKKNTELLYDKVPAIERIFRKKMEKAFASFQNRILGSLALPAKERYLEFIQSYPQFENKIKNYHIASYLGITTESLSRIRKEILLTK